MRSEFPNRLRKDLEQPAPAEHPAPDLLNAYAEHALTAAEEQQVMEHLAACAECREVVFLAQAATDEPVQPALSAAPVKRVRWWAWALPIAAVAVVASAVLLNQGVFAPRNQAKQMAQVRRDEAAPPSPSPNATPQSNPPAEKTASEDKGVSLATETAPPPPKPAAPSRVVTQQNTLTAQSVTGRQTDQLTKQKDANQPTANEFAADLDARRPAVEPKPQVALSAPAASRIPTVKEAQAPPAAVTADSKLRDESAAQSVEVTAEAETVEPSRAKTANLAAKPTANARASYAGALMSSKKRDLAAQWRVTPDGALQHLVVGEWQAALADSGSRFLTVTTFGENVWAGGKNLSLFHSPDNGITWERQTLRVRIAADIVQIAFSSPRDGVLTTNLGTSFVTHDGGKAWAQAAK